MPEYPKTPTLDKMAKFKESSQDIGDFIEWFSKEFEGLRLRSTWGGGILGHWDDDLHEWTPVQLSTEEILARYFKIDMKQAEREKSAILEHMRAQAAACSEGECRRSR